MGDYEGGDGREVEEGGGGGYGGGGHLVEDFGTWLGGFV